MSRAALGERTLKWNENLLKGHVQSAVLRGFAADFCYEVAGGECRKEGWGGAAERGGGGRNSRQTLQDQEAGSVSENTGPAVTISSKPPVHQALGTQGDGSCRFYC